MNKIRLPVFAATIDEKEDNEKPPTASLKDSFRHAVRENIKGIILDENNLNECIDSIISTTKLIKERAKSIDDIIPDSISTTIGVNSNGRVAVLGVVGLNSGITATFQVKFKFR